MNERVFVKPEVIDILSDAKEIERIKDEERQSPTETRAMHGIRGPLFEAAVIL